jgi:hypothetical protein
LVKQITKLFSGRLRPILRRGCYWASHRAN